MRAFTGFLLILSLCLILPCTALSQDFDGSKDLICSVTEVTECATGEGCFQGQAVNFSFPDFFRINFKKKQLSGKSMNQKVLTSPIQHVNQDDGNLILQGRQNGRAWSMVISQESGHYTGTVAGEEFSFSIFGACIRP